MTFEELKNKLEHLRHTKRRLKQQESLIAEERIMMDGVSSFRFDSVAVQGGKKETVQERYVEHMERLLADYQEIMSEVFLLEDFLSAHMADLTPLEQSMLTDRYINGMSWRKIQETFGYEEAQPYRIVSGALKKITDSMKHDSK